MTHRLRCQVWPAAATVAAVVALLSGAAAAQTVAAPVTAPPSPSADFVRPGRPQGLARDAAAALKGLTGSALGAHIRVLASPSFEGRGLQTAGLDAAAAYIANSLERAGVKPLPSGEGRDAWFQPVPIREISRWTGQLTVTSSSGQVSAFSPGTDLTLPERTPGRIEGPAVFAGYGIREAAPARDDYRGLDVSGRTVVVLDGVPPGDAWLAPGLRKKYLPEKAGDRYDAKLELARALGARALVVVSSGMMPPPGPRPRDVFFLSAHGDDDPSVPLVRVSAAVGERLLGGVGRSQAPRPLSDVTVDIEWSGETRAVTSRNVLGTIPGTHPVKAAEAIVIGAHMDHLGTRDGIVHPGADDNASGVAGVLEMARAFASSPRRPARTLVFAFWTGEEDGQLGSGHYTRDPVWPLDRTSVYVNLDMIGHPWRADEIATLVADAGLEGRDAFLEGLDPAMFLEVGAAEWAPDLPVVLVQSARALGVGLHVDRGDGKQGGSDYRAFARQGRPWLRFFGNFFPGYHEPTDTADRLDPEQAARMARLAFVTVWTLANR
jgi:hypothetical protein